MWTYYYLAQHFDFKRDIERALGYIDRALEHTPTLIELFVFKAKIFKVRNFETLKTCFGLMILLRDISRRTVIPFNAKPKVIIHS